jgi:colicin import membrane protein
MSSMCVALPLCVTLYLLLVLNGDENVADAQNLQAAWNKDVNAVKQAYAQEVRTAEAAAKKEAEEVRRANEAFKLAAAEDLKREEEQYKKIAADIARELRQG